MTRSRQVLSYAVLALALAGVATGAQAPVAVSPGGTREVLVEDRCPTFSWGEVELAGGYEIVVYDLSDEDAEAEPVLRKSFPGSVYSWTPSADLCLKRGGRYAWSVRADGRTGASEWSAPSLFQVASEPDKSDLERALEVVRSYLDARAVPDASGDDTDAIGSEITVEGSGAESTSASPSTRFSIVGTTGELTVEGEVRTVDFRGEPRLWGRGRPGGTVWGRVIGGYCSYLGVSYGLSDAAVDWGSAADACPAGSWVCRLADVSGALPCNTGRPHSVSLPEYWLCDGSNGNFSSESAHWGWLADDSPVFLKSRVYGEDGSDLRTPSCASLPVWCCWE